jgi:hypothetical protein
MGKKVRIRIRDEQPGSYFRELRNPCFGLKYLNSLMQIRDPGFGDGKNSDPGSEMFIYQYGTFQNNSLFLVQTGVHGVARSMPTSAAVDRVAAKKGEIHRLFFEPSVFLIGFFNSGVYRTAVCCFGPRKSVLDPVKFRVESQFQRKNREI